MLSALIPPVGRKPAVPLAGQLAHESYVRPGPLVLGTAFLKSPTAASDRDRTVSRMWIPYYYGHRLYLHPISRGWRVMASMGVHGSDINLKKPSLRCCWRRSRYRGTTRPCYAAVSYTHLDVYKRQALKHGRGGQRIALPQPLSVPKRARASSQALGRLVPVG